MIRPSAAPTPFDVFQDQKDSPRVHGVRKRPKDAATLIIVWGGKHRELLMGNEYFTYDDRAHALVGERSGQRFTLGRRVEIRLKEAAPITGVLLVEMLSDPEPRGPNAQAPRLGVRARDRGPGGNGPPTRGTKRPGGPKPPSGGRPSGGLKGVRKGKRR